MRKESSISLRVTGVFYAFGALVIGCGGAGVLSFDADSEGGIDGSADGSPDGGGGDADTSETDSGADGMEAFSIGGSISGLTGTVVLQDNGADNLTRSSDGSFAFATRLPGGAAYDVTALAHPLGHLCTVTNGVGVVATADVTNVAVNCATAAFTVGGSISGLTGTLVLRDNGGNDLTRNANGAFTFSKPLATGSLYDVTILTQPVGERCTVTNGSGTIAASDVTTVSVSCVSAYSIGGSIAGLVGTVVLRNNGGDDLSRTTNGSFAFSAPLPTGATYSVTVLTQPAGKTCTVNPATANGTVGTANVSSVSVNCI